MTCTLIASDRAPGLHVAPGTHVPSDARIAPHVTIYAGTQLGAGVMLEQGAIIGRPQQIDSRSHSPRRPAGELTVIGDGCRLGSYSVVVAGARIGRFTYIGDLAMIRETAVIGDEAMIGRGCGVAHSTRIGDRVRVQNDTLVGAFTLIEEDAFVAGRVVFVGDPTMGRGGIDPQGNSTILRRGCRIGSGAIVIPPLEIGEEAVVGAASVVRADVPPRTVVIGAPAKPTRMVLSDELLALDDQLRSPE
jgi:acetyltransferase-like isoleucine patch superfamily enzyme